jgi:hypothetical protein
VVPWSGKLPRPKVSPVRTLCNCAAEARHGRRQFKVGTLTEALEQITSVSPAMRKTFVIAGDHGTVLKFQNSHELHDLVFSDASWSPF